MAVASLVSGCDTFSATLPSSKIVRDSAGLTIVENAGPMLGEAAWAVANAPSVLIGSTETEDIVRARDAVRLHDGRIVVSDEGAHQVKVFSPTGELIRAVGRDGRGPGEFGHIWSVHPFRGDSLMVYDYSQERVSILDTDGGFGRSFVVTFGPNYWAQGVLMDSMVFLASPGEGRRHADVPGIRWDSTWFVLYRGPDLPVDTIGRYALSEQRGTGAGRPRAYHFGHRTQFALAGDRLYMGSSVSWEIGEYTLRGEVVRSIRRPYEPKPVTPELKARFRQGYIAIIEAEEGNVPPDQLDRYMAFVDEADYPEQLPAYSAMLVDDRGNLWVEDYRIYTDAESTWSVFDREGQWLTTVDMPHGLQVLAIGDAYVLGFIRDDMGLDRVVLFALLKSGESM
jgi:hypothetical protein